MLVLTTLAVVGCTLALLAAGDRWLFADRPAPVATGSATPAGASGSVGLAAPPAGADTPEEQLAATTTALADVLAADPDAVGPAGEGLLASLRQVGSAEGPARRLAAIVTSDSVTGALDAGRLDEAAGRRVLDTLAAVARTGRLIDLILTVEEAPLAVGPAGPQLHADLVTLDHSVPGDRTAARAAELLAAVDAGVAEGRLTPALADVAVPTLQRLADPAPLADLRGLLADAERDPAGIGPAGAQVVEALRTAAGQPVNYQGSTALSLLELVRRDGQVTADFRERAEPVLEALVR